MQKTLWSFLPLALCEQARARWAAGARAAGPGDGYLYHWVAEEAPADYSGPLPFGRLLRRSRGGAHVC
jgi:hypothetical protein